MAFIILLAIQMIRSESDALIENDYYEKGLNYDQEYNLKERVIADKATPVISILNNELVIAFKTDAEGSIKMLRTANKTLDRTLEFETKDKQIKVPANQLLKGQWQFIISWNSNNKSYLNKQEVIIP